MAIILRPNHARLKLKRLESELAEATANLDFVNNESALLQRRIDIADKENAELVKQIRGLKDWIRHVHRLDKIPVSGTIHDILQRISNQ